MSPDEDNESPSALQPASLIATNGLRAINGLRSRNGLSANGLSMNGTSLNGLRSRNGLSSTVGLMTTAEGRETVSYLVRCALPANRSITKADQYGKSYTFTGQIGVAPQWETGLCDTDCQETISACMLAHVNTTGQHIAVWLVGDAPGVGWGQDVNFPYQEGSFFGNIFTSPPKAYFCNGRDFDQGVVPGRLGANQADAPYANPFYAGAPCRNYCTAANAPNDKEGYKACAGFRHVITVWRNFDPTTPYKICNKMSGKCLDNSASTVNGSAVVQRSYTGTTGQKWNIVQVSPKQYKVLGVSGGKALDVFQKLTADGTAIIQSNYRGDLGQLWTFTSMSDESGFHKVSPLSNPAASLALPWQGFYTEGYGVQEWTWNTADSMKWTIAVAN